MHAHGSDRVRIVGERIVLHSRLAKGWTARTPARGTHSEFPGTTVLWDEQYYEVLTAAPLPAGGVRYELAAWREDHTIRQFSVYDAASEAALVADHAAAARQRKRSKVANLSAMLLGHLPDRVQQRLADDLGLFPARMTILSTIPSVVLVGTCVWLMVGATLSKTPSPVPAWLWFFGLCMLADSMVRFSTAMLQNRGVGSVLGTLCYGVYELIARKPELQKTPLTIVREDDPERDLRESVEQHSWLLTLLPASDQLALAERFGFDYRKDAYALAWSLLAVGGLAIATSLEKADERLGALMSVIIGALMILEQALRLATFKRAPAGSVFGVLVRPFMQRLLR
ncbi:MAG TPA: hypothetical protein VF883_20755 [Thermoanaerobaculia bacterium]|jgi:hypothetical protein